MKDMHDVKPLSSLSLVKNYLVWRFCTEQEVEPNETT